MVASNEKANEPPDFIQCGGGGFLNSSVRAL
jgi:hypothetical protein